MTQHAIPFEDDTLTQSVLDAGGSPRTAAEGQTAFRWQGHPRAFVLLTSGALAVHVRTRGGRAPWVACRAQAGEDCMPVTAAILSGCDITVRATCIGSCSWLELPAHRLVRLIHDDPAFRAALFRSHVMRVPAFLSQVSAERAMSVDRRLADWLMGHAASGAVVATHEEIAADLLTAREVVSRKLRDFATKGWIAQERGRIRLEAPGALSRLSRGGFAPPACAGAGEARGRGAARALVSRSG